MDSCVIYRCENVVMAAVLEKHSVIVGSTSCHVFYFSLSDIVIAVEMGMVCN